MSVTQKFSVDSFSTSHLSLLSYLVSCVAAVVVLIVQIVEGIVVIPSTFPLFAIYVKRSSF